MTDRTYELTTLIAQAKGRIDLDPRDDFVCESSVHALSRELELYGNGAKVRRTTRQRGRQVMQIHVKFCSGLIDGLNVVGKKDPDQKYQVAVEGHHGFGLFGCENLTLSNCNISHVPGDFVYMTSVGKKENMRPCRNIILDNVRGDDAGRHAVTRLSVIKLTITESCHFAHYRRQGLDTERSGWIRSSGLVNLGTFLD